MFKKDVFSEILNSILKKYESIQDFANYSNVDRGYLSRHINMKLDNPPTPKILQKIADNSRGVTTYNELMEVCGYIFKKDDYYKDFALLGITPKDLQNVTDKFEEAKKNISSHNYKLLWQVLKERDTLHETDENKPFDVVTYLKKQDKNDKDIDEITHYYEKILDVQLNFFKKTRKGSKDLLNFIEINPDAFKPKFVKIPLLRTIKAGMPAEAFEESDEYETLDAEDIKPNEKYFALRVKGDSMAPNIQNGDIVIIRKQPDVENNQIAAILINSNEATIKKVLKDSRGIVLVPDNPSNSDGFTATFYSNNEIETIPIIVIGRVVQSRRYF